jgi:uncharacterized membrane protein YedE/YeeE
MNSPIVGVIMGVILGASLVLTGLTNPDKIIGALRFKDYYAIRVVVVSVLVAMLGTWILSLFGIANLNIKPAVILPVLIGGACLGIGLGLTGFCPATGLASAASGRIDALITVLGMILGAHVYVLIYPSVVVPLEKIFNFGSVTLPQITGTPSKMWVVPIVAVGSLTLLITKSMKPRIGTGDLGAKERFREPLSREQIAGEESLNLRSDCLKAAFVYRRWKNLLFLVMLLCLLLNQASFWLVTTGQVDITQYTNSDTPTVMSNDSMQSDRAAVPAEKSPAIGLFGFDLTFKLLATILRVTSIVLILTSAFYALIMSFGMSVTFKGKLAGLGYICGALFMAVTVFIMVMPWQNFFGPIAIGATYTPQELIKWCTTDINDTFIMVLFYLRFAGYWALVLILLLLAQLRSFRWVRACKSLV